jgi:hypothetical protein
MRPSDPRPSDLQTFDLRLQTSDPSDPRDFQTFRLSDLQTNKNTIFDNPTITVMKKSSISRRNFLGTAAAAGAAGIVVPAFITSCSTENVQK